MRTTMLGTPARRAARWAVALLLVLATGLSALPSAAAPSAGEVAAAKRELDRLNERLILYVEQYNQARIALRKVLDRLAETRVARTEALAEMTSAEKALNRNAARAYQSVGTQLMSLFDATSLNDFADRLEFIGNIAQADADLAIRAERARDRAVWTAEQLRQAAEERRKVLDEIGRKKDEIRNAVGQARSLYARMNAQFQDAVRSPVGAVSPPRATTAQAQTAIDAAFSVRGVRYVFAAASPSYGFDCSGLTMYAWGKAGVYLPHSSAMQYAVLPHISRSELRPGDLLFFYSPISHVGMYLTPTTMIDANHPGDVVNVRPINWGNFVGAARP